MAEADSRNMTEQSPGKPDQKPTLRGALRGVRLVWKVNGLFLVILAVVLGIAGYITNLDFEQSEIASARDLSLDSSDRIVRRIESLMSAGEAHELGEIVSRMASENPAFREIRLLSHDGRVLASQLPGAASVDSISWPCAVCHAPSGQVRDSVGCSFCEIIEPEESTRALSVVTAIHGGNGCNQAGCHTGVSDSTVMAILQADYSLDRVDALLYQRTRHTAIAILFALILGSIATWLMTERLLGRRIRTLREGALRLAEHDFTFRFSDPTGDGLAQLASVFDNMTSEFSSTLLELMSAKEHLQAIVENSADIIITVDPTGLITTFNPGAEQILGYNREEVIGRRIEMLFADPSERDAAIAKLDTTEHVVNYLTRFVTKEGDIRRVMLTLSRLRSPDGDPIGTMGVSKDITKELELQRRLYRSQRMAALGQAITGIQHSIKNMLNVMKGGSYMVKLALQNDDRDMLLEGWEMVQQGIEDMTEMSKSMLDFARTKKLKIRPTDLGELATSIHSLNQAKYRDEGVALDLEVSPDLQPVECDAEMIRSVIMDLMGNALDACSWRDYEEGESGRVVLGVHPGSQNGSVEIVVSDNGGGMTEEVRERIFTPFFSTKEKKGTGMGLAVVARIVSTHEGKTEVESEPGKGATFRVTLPTRGPSLREE
jgi:two-component system sensor histidine kinase AtoS